MNNENGFTESIKIILMKSFRNIHSTRKFIFNKILFDTALILRGKFMLFLHTLFHTNTTHANRNKKMCIILLKWLHEGV